MKTLKVSYSSKPHAVATSISEIVKTEGVVEVISIGAAALNQATKSIIYAKGNLASMGYTMSCIPSFIEVEINEDPDPQQKKYETRKQPNQDEQEENNANIKTAIKWVVKGIPE